MSNYIQFGSDDKTESLTEQINKLIGDKVTTQGVKQSILILAMFAEECGKALARRNEEQVGKNNNDVQRFKKYDDSIAKQFKNERVLDNKIKQLQEENAKLKELINGLIKENSRVYDAVNESRDKSEIYSDDYLYYQNKQCHVSQHKLAEQTGIPYETIKKRIQRYTKKVKEAD